MSEVQPTLDYHFEHPKTPDGEELQNRFILTFKRPVADVPKEGMQDLLVMPGIDQIQPMGRYTVDMIVAKTFDVEEVKAAIVAKLETLQSGIIQPDRALITP